MKNNTKLLILTGIIVIILVLAIGINNLYNRSEYAQIDTTSTELQTEYDSNELTGNWSDYAAKITLNDSKVIIEGNNVTNNENTIIIKSAGVYYITGSISDGNILIEAGKEDNVQLVLDNCSITSITTAPINGITANKLTITLAENSENVITDSNAYTVFTDAESSEPDAAIFAKTDLVINGTGKLTVNSNYSDGIASKDGLKIINSNIYINSTDDGIRGKDYIAINNANITIDAKGDGLKSTNSEDTQLGYIAIEGGTINVIAKADGIQAETVLNISQDANINIITNGEITSSKQNYGFSGFSSYQSTSSNSEDSKSSKGLKAGSEITVDGATIEIESADDSIHSNGIVVIHKGTINVSSGDDGIHADTNIVINDGNIDIKKSYEGIESSYIEINGGAISVVASDDGINVAGGNDSSSMSDRPGKNNFSTMADSARKLVINNGNITVNSTGDGLDANGSIYINGGNVLVAGPTSGGNGALDYDSECVIAGGNVIIYGSTDMWLNPSNSSIQYSLTYKVSGKSEDNIVLKDSSGNEVCSFNTIKSYGAITISNSSIQKGVTYTLDINGTTAGNLTVNSIVTSNSSLGGNGGMDRMQQPGNKRF